MKNSVPEKKYSRLTDEELTEKLKAWFSACSEPFPLVVTGHSMKPFMSPERDTAFLYRYRSGVKKGDIILYRTPEGGLLLHRVIRVRRKSILTAGDSKTVFDEKTTENEIIAVCRRVCRNGKIYTEESLYWRFFSKIWTALMPLRRAFLWFILKLKATG